MPPRVWPIWDCSYVRWQCVWSRHDPVHQAKKPFQTSTVLTAQKEQESAQLASSGGVCTGHMVNRMTSMLHGHAQMIASPECMLPVWQPGSFRLPASCDYVLQMGVKPAAAPMPTRAEWFGLRTRHSQLASSAPLHDDMSNAGIQLQQRRSPLVDSRWH